VSQDCFGGSYLQIAVHSNKSCSEWELVINQGNMKIVSKRCLKWRSRSRRPQNGSYGSQPFLWLCFCPTT
jgi:hypothetical protein